MRDISITWPAWLVPLLGFAISLTICRIMLSGRWRGLALDRPNQRSLHSVPIPRTGGVGIILGAGSMLLAEPEFALVWVTASGLAMISLLDDRHGLPVSLRLMSHIGASVVAAHWILPDASWWVLGVITICVTCTINFYNFMDGTDGLAGAMASIGFAAMAIATWMVGEYSWACAQVSVTAAVTGFLLCNWPPARLFMGDVGSIPLGFLVATSAALGWSKNWWPIWFPAVVFAPFALDASVTLMRRAFRGARVWQAHREHYYQRLVLMGWSKVKLLRYAMVFMMICALWALSTLAMPVRWQVASLGLFIVTFGWVLSAIDRKWYLFCRSARGEGVSG